MYVTQSMLVVPESMKTSHGALLLDGNEHGKIQVFSGTQAVKNYGISVQGSGSWATGRITGKLTTYDYKALYQVYQLPSSESAKYWFVSYSKDTSTSELKKTFESVNTFTTDYDVGFQIQGNDYGISSVYITFEVIRLTLDGVTKDFVVSNPNSAAATNPDGNPYPGGFKPVPHA